MQQKSITIINSYEQIKFLTDYFVHQRDNSDKAYGSIYLQTRERYSKKTHNIREELRLKIKKIVLILNKILKNKA